MECLPSGRGGLGAKHMRLQRVAAIGNTLGEHIWNLMGTHWELEGNKEKMKKSSPTPLPNLIEKKSRHFECMLRLPIGCMKFSISKTVGHHVRPGLIPLL
jgi:hypothetical protein